MGKIFRLIFIWLIIFLFFTQELVFAENNFDIKSDITYKVSDDGNATVTQNFLLTNLNSNLFATQYVFMGGDLPVYNLRAYDRKGVLDVTVQKDSAGNPRFVINFQDQAIGLGKSLYFSVVYDTPGVAKKIGRIWQVFLPPLAANSSVSDYTIGLYIPESFGKQIYLKPKADVDTTVWSKASAGATGVMAAFDPNFSQDSYQAYDFKLRFHLYNDRLFPITTEVALPPDTAYQKIFLANISPMPLDVNQDKDGNWIAKYYLGPLTGVEVNVNGSAAVFINSVVNILGPKTNSEDTLPATYWEVNDKTVGETAQRLSGPAEIYDFTRRQIHFDPAWSGQQEKRSGAKKALTNLLSSSPRDYSDLFIALTRSKGIPAREIEGYVASSRVSFNQSSFRDSLQSWVEYFNPNLNQFVMADPALSSASHGLDFFNFLDFDHLAFVVHGQDSLVPYPAGTYRSPGFSKDVEVTPSDKTLDASQSAVLAFRADIPLQITAGLGLFGKIYLANNGPTAADNQTIILTSNQLNLDKSVVQSGILPPFANREIEVSAPTGNWFSASSDIISITVNGETKNYPVKIIPIYQSKFIVVVGGALILGFISLIAQITRSLSHERLSGKDNIRREG